MNAVRRDPSSTDIGSGLTTAENQSGAFPWISIANVEAIEPALLALSESEAACARQAVGVASSAVDAVRSLRLKLDEIARDGDLSDSARRSRSVVAIDGARAELDKLAPRVAEAASRAQGALKSALRVAVDATDVARHREIRDLLGAMDADARDQAILTAGANALAGDDDAIDLLRAAASGPALWRQSMLSSSAFSTLPSWLLAANPTLRHAHSWFDFGAQIGSTALQDVGVWMDELRDSFDQPAIPQSDR